MKVLKIHVALLSTLVLTLALTTQASAVTYRFVGFFNQGWDYNDTPPHTVGGWGGYGTTSAADIDSIATAAQPVYYTSAGQTTVAKVLNYGWSGGNCPANDLSMALEIQVPGTGQVLGIVTIGHLSNVHVQKGAWAFDGLQIADMYPSASNCSSAPHLHVEKTSAGEWINCGGDNTALQAVIRYGGSNSNVCAD